MNKPICIVASPIDCYSGYSARSRDIVKSLIKLKGSEWDIKLLSLPWGSCPWNYLKDHNETDLLSRIIPGLNAQPEIWIQISIPNEFQAVGKYNIGITAGIETDLCDPSWLEGLNRMTLNLVSSTHAKTIFEKTIFEKKDHNKPNYKEIIKLEKPVEILFEGVDLNKYHLLDQHNLSDLNLKLDSIPEKFAFLFVGHWLQGDLGQDRKDVGMLIKVFLETFKNKQKQPALILKTNSASPSIMDREEILKKINLVRETVKGTLPNIYLIHGDLKDQDMNGLYNHPKIKSFVSFTKGEGFGRPLLEFTTSAKPVITSNWSGHLDFLKPEFNNLLNGHLKQIDPTAVVPNMLLAESKWFTVDYTQAGMGLRDMFENYKNWEEKGKRQAYHTKTNFSLDKMTDLLGEYLKRIPEFPKFVPINLPKINTELKLPKLMKLNNDK